MYTNGRFWRGVIGLYILLPLFIFCHAADALASDVLVLNYHQIGKEKGNLFTVSEQGFKDQLDYLSRHGYESISLDDFSRFISGENQDLPQKPILMTFDDGLSSHYSFVYPQLKKHGLTGAFFIVADHIGKPARLSRKQIIEMAENGNSFGSHSMSHRSFVGLAEDDVRKELSDSREVIERIISHPVRFIAYPYGLFDEAVIKSTEAAGYLGAFTIIADRNSASTRPFQLHRIVINRDVNKAVFQGLLEGDVGIMNWTNLENIKFYMENRLFFNAKTELEVLLKRDPNNVLGRKLLKHVDMIYERAVLK